jgi:hypothetical protein
MWLGADEIGCGRSTITWLRLRSPLCGFAAAQVGRDRVLQEIGFHQASTVNRIVRSRRSPVTME